MMKFTAVTRVLTRWMLYTLAGVIVLRLWGEGMFYLGHLSISEVHPCGGAWFSSSLHFSLHVMMVIAMTVITAGISTILWFLGMWAQDLVGVFWKAVDRERDSKLYRNNALRSTAWTRKH